MLPDRIRHRFPIFEHSVYLNSCSQGALSDAVQAAYEDYLAGWADHGSPWDHWVERTEHARTLFARLVNADPDEIAVTTSLSAAVSSLASGLRYAGPRSQVLLTELEFPTVGQIWNAQADRGARVGYVRSSADGTISTERFAGAIGEETLLVSITHVSYETGARLAVKEITELAHARGALVLLDAYQSVGALPIDVRELGVDFLAAGTVKYLLGSAGLAFLYCRRDLVERVRPTATGWFADDDPNAMDVSDYSPSPTARRFELGTPPVPAVFAGIAGTELMLEIGLDETQRHVNELNARLLEGLSELGATVRTPSEQHQRGPLVSVASNDAPALVAALLRERIVTSSRAGNVRISSHCYNSAADIDALLEALARNRRLLDTGTAPAATSNVHRVDDQRSSR